MTENLTGYFAYSTAGHDAGSTYIIVESDAKYVWLSDGRLKSQTGPKKKNRKHVQLTGICDADIKDKLDAQKPIADEDIRKAIKKYKVR